jgi:alpha-L-fucosidase
MPAPQQLAWHELLYFAFVHFNINTFSDVEWRHDKKNLPFSTSPGSTDANGHSFAKRQA